MQTIMCTKGTPWDGIARPGTMVLHPDARKVDELDVKRGIDRRCPNCGYEWLG